MKYFAYGMNTILTQMASRCPSAVCLGPAWINDYRLVFRGVADIEPAPDIYCDGVLWDLTDSDLAALDILEGYPYHYTRFTVLVHTETGSHTALVYQMVDQDAEYEPSGYYFDMVHEGYTQNGVPVDQLFETVEMQ